MKRIAAAVCVAILLPGLAAEAQSPGPKPPAELRSWDLWVGDWTMVGTARDTPTEPEYALNWELHGSWILGGFFVQVDHVWKGKGLELQELEILSYDPVKRVHASAGFASDGSTWLMTATFDERTSVENGTTTTADGKVIAWRNTWVFSADHMEVSGTSESEQDGVRWTSFAVKGTRARPPARIP